MGQHKKHKLLISIHEAYKGTDRFSPKLLATLLGKNSDCIIFILFSHYLADTLEKETA